MLIRVERFTSTAIDDLRISFTCAACNAVAVADVIVANSAETAMPIHVIEPLRESARRDAVAGLPQAAQQLLGLAGCPRCRAMDPGVARNERIIAALVALGTWYGVTATVIAIVVGVIGLSDPSITTRLISFAIAAGLLAIPLILGGRTRFAAKRRAAEARVTWREPTATSARPIGPNASTSETDHV